jgi:hypothetical protein
VHIREFVVHAIDGHGACPGGIVHAVGLSKTQIDTEFVASMPLSQQFTDRY